MKDAQVKSLELAIKVIRDFVKQEVREKIKNMGLVAYKDVDNQMTSGKRWVIGFVLNDDEVIPGDISATLHKALGVEE